MVSIRQFVEFGLALAAGVTIYVAASDLIPEVNKMAGNEDSHSPLGWAW